jgi:hypothetical protein
MLFPNLFLSHFTTYPKFQFPLHVTNAGLKAPPQQRIFAPQ